MPAMSISLTTTVFLRELQGAQEELSRWENKASPIRHHLQGDTQRVSGYWQVKRDLATSLALP